MPNNHSNAKLITRSLFRGADFFMVSKLLIKELGLNQAVYLSCLLDKEFYFEKLGMLQNDGSFFCLQKQIAEEVGLSQFQQKKLLDAMIDNGFVEVKVRDAPPKNYYLIIHETLISWSEKIGFQSPNNSDLHINKNKAVITKNNNKVDFISMFPDQFKNNPSFISAFRSWEVHRKKKKCPLDSLTERGMQLQIKEFVGWGVKDSITAMETSEKLGYQGVFKPKEDKKPFEPPQPLTKQDEQKRRVQAWIDSVPDLIQRYQTYERIKRHLDRQSLSPAEVQEIMAEVNHEFCKLPGM